MTEPTQTSNQGRIGVEGRAGTTFPGNLYSRSTLRYVFVGGMVAAGLTWYASSRGWLGSTGDKLNAASRGNYKPPTVVGKEHTDEGVATTRPHGQALTGVGQGQAEGRKMV